MKKETKQLLSIGGYMGKMVAHYRNYWFIYGALSAFFLKESYLCNRCSFSKTLGYSLSSPISGVVLRISIRVLGKNASRGNNLVIEQGNGGKKIFPCA